MKLRLPWKHNKVEATAKAQAEVYSRGIEYSCGGCGAWLGFTVSHKYCEHCGVRLNWWWRCPGCDRLAALPVDFCRWCGSKLPNEPVETSEPVPSEGE